MATNLVVVDGKVSISAVKETVANRSSWLKKADPKLPSPCAVSKIIATRDENDNLVPIGAKVGNQIARFSQLADDWTAPDPCEVEVRIFKSK